MWELLVNGEEIQRGFFDIDLPAQQSVIDTIPFRMPEIEVFSECVLQVSFVLKEDTKWAKAGHEVAWNQLAVPAITYYVEKPKPEGEVNATENQNRIEITGNNFKYILDRKTGEFSSIKFNGVEYLAGGPVFNIWRAPLANDVDGWGSYTYKSSIKTPGLGRSIDNQLRTLGMRDLVSQVDEVEILQLSGSLVSVRIKAYSNASLPANLQKRYGRNSSAFERNEIWTFLPDGTIELQQEIIPQGTMPEMLPKIGLQFQLPKTFNQVEWFGRGPFETYPDRRTGAKIGVYKSSADKMFVPYIMPQDYGNRTDVGWLKVENESGNGLLIKGGEKLNFSLHKYSTDNLSRAMHIYELQDVPTTILNIDYEVSGVGGTAIRQLQKYRVCPGIRNYKLTIKPY